MPQISPENTWQRLLALAIGLLLVAAASFSIVRWYWATEARTARDEATLRRAVRLEPDNADYWHRLGQWEEQSFGEGSVPRALENYRRATELNRFESRYWLDLANLLELTGERAQAEAAVASALRVDPRSPQTLWRVGNFWLRTAEPQRAFPYLQQALLADPSLAAALLQTCHKAIGDPEVLLREVVPHEPRFLLVYLRVLVRAQLTAAAAPVWRRLVEIGGGFEARQALFYVNHLLDTAHVADALEAWNDLKRLRLIPVGAQSEELLYNADLRQPILNGGFDWRAVELPRVSVTLEPGAGEEAPAVVIRFSGEDNLDYHHFYQLVPVEPNQRYRFTAWMATAGVTTESGPRLEVFDPYDSQLPPARSAALIGDSARQQLLVDFTSGPRTRVLRVGVARLPSRRLAGEIRGTVRASEFSLRRVSR
ncbi:MAG TPA: hypothetical protein VNN18_10070 [Candidatus Xenobia bacterium]|nr:hypothetical protein [Candidatus Xenobia bacterium]